MANLRRFYTERTNLRTGSSVKLPEEEVQHIYKSLRLQANDHIILFNGETEFIARLKVVSNDMVMAEIVEEVESTAPESKQIQITLFQSMIRLPQFELVVQKSTELGVDRIVPLDAEFSQVKINNWEKRTARWGRIVMESCKQSERASIPELGEVIELNQVQGISEELGIDELILFTTPREVISKIAPISELKNYLPKLQNAKHVGLLVGPEGGFSPSEHKHAADAGIPFVSFNNNILRAETAGVVVVGILKAML